MKSKVLILIVAYNAEAFIESVLRRIPEAVFKDEEYDAEVLILDDQSTDRTFDRAVDYAQQRPDLPITTLYNPINQGYGGNQKIGYHYAIQNHFDVVVLLHGDGQYPPERIPQMIAPLLAGEADAVLGSRMCDKMAALEGGMPLYKWVGNRILTAMQNRILASSLSEFHTGYRAYRVSALASLPIGHNSDYFDFDTDIIIQLLDTGKRLREIPIPTHYGGQVSRVNGLRYGGMVLRTSVRSRLARRGLVHHPKFDYRTARPGLEVRLDGLLAEARRASIERTRRKHRQGLSAGLSATTVSR